ncbi:MAG: flagellar basal body-associated protein FliL [Chitinispirillaceae bacterium]
MNKKKNEPEQNAEVKKSPAKSGNKILLLGILAVILAVQTTVVYFLVPKPGNPEEAAAKARSDSLTLAAEQMTEMGATTIDAPIEAVVNIAGTDGERFLKVVVILEYETKNERLGAELRRRAPRHKDLLLDHMSKLSLIEVTEPDARNKIRKDLLRLINNTLPADLGKVNDVLFTQYIIQ